MGRTFRLLLQSILPFILAVGAHANSDAAVPPDATTKVETPSEGELSAADEEWLKKTPLKTKVGQLFIFGFMGYEVNGRLKQTLETQKPGAIIVFGRNIRSGRQLIDMNHAAQKAAQKASGLPLLIAVDQEGGSVIRIRTSPPLPSALALGESGSPEIVHSAGLHTGHLLKALGFNMNLAPVLDVADPRTDPFVGTRTFGKDPEKVSRLGNRFAKGLSEAGILATAKHFPGHGGVADSHTTTPIKDSSLETLNKVDLLPFASGFRDIPETAVMLAHIAYPKLDVSNTPATFSKPIVTELLREKMGFDGLVVTDDIEMAGAFVVKDPAERAVRAVEAGVDLVMIAWNRRLQEKAVTALFNAVKSGRVPESRINESLRRILRVKRRVAPPTKNARPSTETLQAILKSQELQKLTFDTLKRQFETSLAKLHDRSLTTDGERPIFLFAGTDRFHASFKEGLKGRNVRFYRLTDDRTFDINRIMRANPNALGILHIGGRQSARYANQIDADNASRVIVVNSETASLLKNPDAFHHIVYIYFRHPDLGRLSAQYLFKPPSKPETEAEEDATSLRVPAQKKKEESEDEDEE